MTGDTICQIEGEDLVIRVRLEALATAAEIILPERLGIDPLRERPVKVTDATVWANEIVYALLQENEIGETRITKMLDDAFEHALEYGAEGIEVEEAPEEHSDD